MPNLDSILKSRDITLSTKVHLVKAMVFPVVMYWRESWTIKKVERKRKTEAFELCCWRRRLRVPWTEGSNQSILNEISPEYSLERLMLKLKLQYFGHLMWRADSLEKTLMMGNIEDGRRRGDREWDGWMPSPTQWTWVRASSRIWWWTRKPGVLQSMGSQRVRHDWATELTDSAYKLNKQGDNIQLWHTPFPIWNQSVVPHLVLTVASWPAHKFLRRQVRWSGITISWRIFHSLLWSTQPKALA